MKDKRICIFAGSNPGDKPDYADAATALGNELVGRGLGLVYGGGNTGLMGAVADAALAGGGEVIGVIPEFLADHERKIAHERASELHVVATMHERKAMMFELSAGFVALPGGLGTFEEILEMLTWGQLGLHEKPCAVLNVNGYFDRLLNFLDHAVAERFLKPEHREMLIIGTTPQLVLDALDAYQRPRGDKWLSDGVL